MTTERLAQPGLPRSRSASPEPLLTFNTFFAGHPKKIGTRPERLKVRVFLGFAGAILVTFHSYGKLHGVITFALVFVHVGAVLYVGYGLRG